MRAKRALKDAKIALIQSVIADRMQGLTYPQLAKKYAISERSAVNYCNIAKAQKASLVSSDKPSNSTPDKIVTNRAISNYINDLELKSIDAIKSGLDCDSDPYKRGSLGVQVMRGIGKFGSEDKPNQINILVQSMPAELLETLRHRLTVANPSPIIDIPLISGDDDIP